MPTIDISTLLTSGAQYAFTFEPVGVLSYLEHPDLGAVNSAVQAISTVANASVSVGVPGQLGGTDFYTVAFTYAGDGSDAGAVVAQAIIDALNAATSVSWQFIGGTTGTQGVQQQNQSTNSSFISSLSSLNPISSSSLWAILLIVAVVAFLAYGGGGLIRRATA